MTNIIGTVREQALKLPCLLGWGHKDAAESEREQLFGLLILSVTYVTLDTSITDYNLQHIL